MRNHWILFTFWARGPLVHWAKAQSELASVFDKNGKGVAIEGVAIEGVAFEPLPACINKQ